MCLESAELERGLQSFKNQYLYLIIYKYSD